MPKSTTPNRGRWNRRQLVAYYPEWPGGGNRDSVARQKEIIATWASENGYEIVEEVIDRRPDLLPADCHFEVGGTIKKHATKQGDTLYVYKMDACLWRRWRRSDMSLQFDHLSKNQGDRAIFVATAKEIVSYVALHIWFARYDHCDMLADRARIAAARRRGGHNQTQE